MNFFVVTCPFSIDSVILHNEGVETQEGRKKKRKTSHWDQLSIWVLLGKKVGIRRAVISWWVFFCGKFSPSHYPALFLRKQRILGSLLSSKDPHIFLGYCPTRGQTDTKAYCTVIEILSSVNIFLEDMVRISVLWF